MAKKVLINQVEMVCPMCGLKHLVDEYEESTSVEINGITVPYSEHYYHCKNASDDDQNFYLSNQMDANLKRARTKYREISHS